VSSFRELFLSGSAHSGQSPSDVITGHFDLLIVTSSWDSRCKCLSESDVSADHGVGLFFSNRGQGELRDEHDPVMTRLLEERCTSYKPITLPSEALYDLWDAIWHEVEETAKCLGRPLRVLLDLSTCPRFYAMALVAEGFNSHLVHELTTFYAEGDYPEPPAIDPHELFTSGSWATVAIPGISASPDPAKKRFYLVSVGFEGSKTLRAVTTDGADRVSVLFPKPGVKPEYVDRTASENANLKAEYRIPDTQFIDAPAGDAVAAWRALAETPLETDDDNVFYLCCGTKAHSLGMALHAYARGHATVLYAKPARHKEARIAPLGTYWRYTVRDLSYVDLSDVSSA
jgi:hypothetical protein